MKQQRMESELARCKDVIAEITVENLELKKDALRLSDYGKLPAVSWLGVQVEFVGPILREASTGRWVHLLVFSNGTQRKASGAQGAAMIPLPPV